MAILSIAIVAGLIFGLCYLVDKAFTKKFRAKAQHRSGLAVRANKQYGIFGVILTVLGIMALLIGAGSDKVLLFGGGFVVTLGICLAAYYLSFGIFYDGESFLVSKFGKRDREYRHSQIVKQHLYIITGGNTLVELEMDDGTTVSVHSQMDGMYPFLDTAFAGWCLGKHIDPRSCKFHDPSKSWWFPHDEEEG